MSTFLRHLTMIAATMIGGVLLLSSNVSGQMLGDPQPQDVRNELMHSTAKVFSPEAIEAGRYYTSVDIAARPIRFLIDTGASYTVLTPSDAELLGFTKIGTVKVDTMGGEVEMLKGRVPSMKVGDVTLAQVDVLVSGKLKVSLMGVDTLHRLGATHLSLQLT
jgi:clan AA aspartic protease (TIGR02281 family)